MKKLFAKYVTFVDLWALTSFRYAVKVVLFGFPLIFLAGCSMAREFVRPCSSQHPCGQKAPQRCTWQPELIIYDDPDGNIRMQWATVCEPPKEKEPKKRAPNKKCNDFAADPNGVWPDDCAVGNKIKDHWEPSLHWSWSDEPDVYRSDDGRWQIDHREIFDNDTQDRIYGWCLRDLKKKANSYEQCGTVAEMKQQAEALKAWPR